MQATIRLLCATTNREEVPNPLQACQQTGHKPATSKHTRRNIQADQCMLTQQTSLQMTLLGLPFELRVISGQPTHCCGCGFNTLDVVSGVRGHLGQGVQSQVHQCGLACLFGYSPQLTAHLQSSALAQCQAADRHQARVWLTDHANRHQARVLFINDPNRHQARVLLIDDPNSHQARAQSTHHCKSWVYCSVLMGN